MLQRFHLLPLAAAVLTGGVSVWAMSLEEGRSAAIKINRISNDELQPGEEVALSEEEINSYLHYVYAEELPNGVRGMRVRFSRDTANVRGYVDIAKLAAESNGPSGFFLRLLRGERLMDARVRYVSSNGEARIDVESLKLDGREMKGVLLDWLVNSYVAPNMDGFALGEPVEIGHNIERIKLEAGQALVIAQGKTVAD